MFHTKFVEKIDTHFKFNIPRSRKNAPNALYEKGCKAQQATDDNTVHSHCMLDKATDTCTLYAIFTAFTLQQWLHKRASALRYTYTAC
jgi:hypothetical protein